MYQFKSQGSYFVNNCRVFTVKNPKECYDFDWLIGKQVVIDKSSYIVIDIEKQAITTAIKKDELIGLMVKEIISEKKLVAKRDRRIMIKDVDYL